MGGNLGRVPHRTGLPGRHRRRSMPLPPEHRVRPRRPPGAFAVLHAAMRNTISEAVRTIELMSRFAVGDVSENHPNSDRRLFREQTALRDCIELLDLSVDELGRSAREVEAMRGSPGDARRHGNVMAWMSAALGNQDTCLEGFDGTDGRLREHIQGSVTQVTELLAGVMRIYKTMHSLAPLNDTADGGDGDGLGLPPWMPRRRRPDAVVALDASGDYRSIMDAVDKAPDRGARLYVIYVKEGVYEENVEVRKKKTRIALVGDGMGRTVISGGRSVVQGWTTFRTATLAATGVGFIASDMTIRNTAGQENHQAVALRVDSDCSAFYRCSIEGHQDTLYAHSSRQFYRDCNIYGTVDFIFGNGNIVVQHSQIIVRPPLPSRSQTGFSIHGCSVLSRYPTYLGRPWKQFSTVVFMQTYLDAQVQPAGWLAWNGDFAVDTLFYGEFGNHGPGSPTSRRVKWPGYHILDVATARLFTVQNFIKGQFWLPATGVRFVDGLL
ncbi:unnamed protein product [Spirodela intermedia]|uniref:Pectinesterase n=1 Tax=Spirodela intermedia TaxID=51605 RepID=A0A7I8IBT8_SPIIN|nr:unnamed protein product [Spirodela intermedia]CAA6654341.1 unnamed protein product [Spirodela intermedia]